MNYQLTVGILKITGGVQKTQKDNDPAFLFNQVRVLESANEKMKTRIQQLQAKVQEGKTKDPDNPPPKKSVRKLSPPGYNPAKKSTQRNQTPHGGTSEEYNSDDQMISD